MAEPLRSLSVPTQRYVAAVIAGAALVAVCSPHRRPDVEVALILIAAAMSLVPPLASPTGGISIPNLAPVIVIAVCWTPSEALIGIGVGTLIGQRHFRRSERWRAWLNGAVLGLSAMGASWVAHRILAATTVSIESISIAALAALVTLRVLNHGLLAGYLSLRFQRRFFAEWHKNALRNWSSQLLSVPMAVVVYALWVTLKQGVPAGLVLTALSALSVPLARQELVYYYASKATLAATVDAVMVALDGAVPGSRNHGERVSALAVNVGQRFGIREHGLLALGLAGRLHDVGILAPASTASLSAHAALGARMLAPFPDPTVAEMVRSHHDPWRGRRATATADAALGGHILTAVEVYDSARAGLAPFAHAHSAEETAALLRARAGADLDPTVVPVVLEVVRRTPPAAP